MSNVQSPLTLRPPASGKSAPVSGLTLPMTVLAGALAWPAAAQSPPAVDLAPVTVEGATPGPANPNADPAAPLKIDRSASTKLVKPLLDTPRSVTAISKEQIEESGATSLKDVLRQQPGITLGTGEGGNAFGDRVFIRGFDARNDIFIDGMRDPGVTSRESFAIEQIEIIKGPSSTIGGRGTTGGSVDLVTKTPKPSDFTEMDITLGTDMTKRVVVDINRVLSAQVSVRASGVFHDAEVAGRNEVFDKRYGGMIAVEYKPVENWSLLLDYYGLKTDALPDWGIPYDTRVNKPFAVSRDSFYGITGRDYWNTSADIFTARLTGKLTDNLKLDVRARYGVTTNDYVVSAPEGVNLTALTVNANAKTRNQENKASLVQASLIWDFATGFAKHTMVGGVEASRELVFNRPPGVTPRAVSQKIYAPNPNVYWSGSVTEGGSVSDSTIDSYAFYLLDTVELGKQWQVSFGLRHDNFDIGVYSGPGDYVGTATRAYYEKSFLNWNLGLVYKPVPYGSIYAAVSTSSNPPGEQVDGGVSAGYGGLATGYQNYAPERNTNYEIGSKWNLFNEHLAVTGALFWIEKENLLNSANVSGVTRYNNDGAARVRGVEMTVAGNIMPGWSVAGGFTVMESEIRKNPLNPTSVGKELANGARNSLSLQTKYRIDEDLAIGGTATFRSAVHGGTLEANATRIPSYWRFDLMGEYTLTDHASVRLNVLNLFNKTYYDTLYRSNSPFVYVAPGRSALLTLSLKY